MITGIDVGVKKQNRRVLAFGVFDPLHKGHEHFLEQAKKMGRQLLVVVARDSYIRAVKKREPQLNEATRKLKVEQLEWVDKVILGEEWPVEDQYGLLQKLSFDVLVLGYDQKPDDVAVKKELASKGRRDVVVVRLKSFKPKQYKSSLMPNADQ